MITISLLAVVSLTSCKVTNNLTDSKRISEPDKEIRTTIQNYFDGRRNADLSLLRKAFSKDARLMTTNSQQQLIIISLENYFSVVRKQGEISVETTIKEINFEDQLAYVRVEFKYADKSYTDYLLLIKLDIGWRIVNKSFKLNNS